MSQDTPSSPARSYDARSSMPYGDLRSYMTVVRRRKWTVIAVTAITVLTAAFFSSRQTPMYRSSATVWVKALDPSQVLTGLDPTYYINMSTEETLATSPDVARLAADKAAEVGVASADTGSVSASTSGDTTFLEIGYSATDPKQAADWAQAYALAYQQYRFDQAQQQHDIAVSGFDAQAREVRDQLDSDRIALDEATGARRQALQASIREGQNTIQALEQSKAAVAMPSLETAATVMSPAAEPLHPYAPDWRKNLAVALFAGLALGLAVAFLRERLDDRMNGRDDLEEAAGAPVLAIVPQVSGWRKRSKTTLVARDQPKGGAAEAYRTIRTNISFLAKSSQLKVVSIASAGTGEGKTTTTANLAVALAQTGKRVIAVSCDLRKPRLHRFFDLHNDSGVTSILLDGVSVPQVAQRVAGIDNLRVIASGPVPHNPAELLGSDEMESLIAELRRYADFVIVDTAPVLAVSDSLAMAPKTDGVVLVADASSTHKSAVWSSREQLEQVGANIVGAIFNNFDPSKAKSYPGYYRYGYYGTSPYAEAAASPKPKRQPQNMDPSEFWR